jgi:hypothetical protein
VTEVVSSKYIIDILYVDGEEELDLALGCIRPFVPFHVGETVEVSIEDTFYRGIIVEAYTDDVFDIETQDGRVQKFVDPYMRRFVEAQVFQRGDLIEARFNRGDEWFKGEITKKRRDGLYAISYLDGDFEKAVSPELIRWA